MLSQQTPPETVNQEKQCVKQLTGVSDVNDVIFNNVGWTSRVYIVGNGQFVVKFPRDDEVKREYVRELAVLRLLGQIECAVQVPKLRWWHPNNDYLGYEGIVGDEFAPVALHTGSSARKAIGRAVGSFLKRLHALNLDSARVVTVQDEIDEFQHKYRLSSAVITRDFTGDEQAKLASLIEEELPRELLRLGENPALCHGDLGFWNMILKDDGQIGIVDFGDTGYYDRSKDFMGLRDPELLDAALATYGDNEVLRRKIALRQKVLHILDLPFFIGKEDEVGISKTVSMIKAAIE